MKVKNTLTKYFIEFFEHIISFHPEIFISLEHSPVGDKG